MRIIKWLKWAYSFQGREVVRKHIGWFLLAVFSWLFVIDWLWTPSVYSYTNPALVPAGAEDREVRSSAFIAKVGQAGEILTESSPQPDIESLIRQTFPEYPDTMVQIARAESHFKNEAVNINRNGSKDCGIFQVNSVHGYDCDWLKNPENNLKAAREVFDKQGLTAWSTYNFAVENGLPI
jgi:hypothetical protein